MKKISIISQSNQANHYEKLLKDMDYSVRSLQPHALENTNIEDDDAVLVCHWDGFQGILKIPKMKAHLQKRSVVLVGPKKSFMDVENRVLDGLVAFVLEPAVPTLVASVLEETLRQCVNESV